MTVETEWASLFAGYLLGLLERARAEGHTPWLVDLVETTPTTMTLDVTTRTMATAIRLTVQVDAVRVPRTWTPSG